MTQPGLRTSAFTSSHVFYTKKNEAAGDAWGEKTPMFPWQHAGEGIKD